MSDPYAAFSDPVGAAPTPRRAVPSPRSRPQINFADDIDALTRTVIGEAGNQGPDGQRAVAAVALNRARQRNMTPTQVVLELNQFEPWGNPATARRLLAISPSDPRYAAARREVESAMAGNDPTGGADHFYAPKAQAALGRRPPSWATGTPTVIGDHHFYNLGGSTEDRRVAAASAQPSGASEWDSFSDPVASPAVDEPAPIEMVIDRGTQNINGRAIERGGGQPDIDRGPWDAYQASLRKSRAEREALAKRREDPVYQAEYARAKGGAEAVPGGLAATLAGQTLGGRGIVPWLTGAVSYVDALGRGADAGLASQAARDATRDTMDAYARENPGQNLGYQLLGGLLTPGLKGTGDWVGSATGAQRLARAGAVGGATGAASGLLNSEGDLASRAVDTVMGAGSGAATMGLLDAGSQRAFRAATRAGTGAASNARQLSRKGVMLTPAQMIGDVPGVGSLARTTEDVASGLLPFVQGARNRGIESFDRTITNEALAPIGQTLPRGVRGRDAIKAGNQILSDEYNRILSPITVTPDAMWTADLSAALAPSNLSRQARRELNDWTADLRARFQGPINGNDWKQIDSELSSAIATAPRPLASSLRQVRTAFEAALERSAPGSLAQKKAADAAYANFDRVRRAAANPATGRNDELFTASNLNSILARAENRAYAQGEARLQETTDQAETVLAPTVGNTGSGQRAIIGAGLLGGGVINPAVAIPTVVATLAYSKPAQSAINAIYQATDSATAMEALGELQRFAARNPALRPYYEEALRHVLPDQGRQPPEPLPAPSPASLTTPATSPERAGLLSPTPR